jgi:demethylmenaquinone methyltransferase/2-methoxy-6-polyprenyl-1,4-benzoquinol methylase
VHPGGRVIGIDFSAGMLELARQREPDVDFRLGDVTRLSESDASIDAVTVAFGLRNLVDREAAIREVHRVLRPGRRFVILEFAPPPRGLLMSGYRFYLNRVMPALTGLRDASQADAYRYLADSVQAFLPPAELTAMLERLEFRVSVESMTFGVVTIHTAIRQG